MRVHYYTAPCGAGKSYAAAERMVNCTGRYIVVRDRVEAIVEYSRQLSVMAAEVGQTVMIAAITNTKGKSVRLEIEDIPNTYDSVDHCIILITHKAMQMCDFSGFYDWHVIIDETPTVLDKQELKTGQSHAFFERNYHLAEIGRGWSGVTLNRDGWNITPADLERDDCYKILRVFHERVTAATPLPEDATRTMARRSHDHESSRRAVISNLREWADMKDGRQWTWWSLWSPRQLEVFASVLIMANAFDQSMTYRLLRNLNPGIEWVPVPLTNARTFAPRRVEIEYFARQHAASQTMFDCEEGQANLRAIATYLASADQIWMANERHQDNLCDMGGEQLRPQQSGSNKFAAYHHATAIYSAKPSEETRGILELLGVDPAAWVESNEYEVILQFATRTSIRDPNSTETVRLSVYDHAQASYLADYFATQSHCEVSLNHVDLQLQDRERKRGRPVLNLTIEEADAKKAARMASRTAAQKARRAKTKLNNPSKE